MCASLETSVRACVYVPACLQACVHAYVRVHVTSGLPLYMLKWSFLLKNAFARARACAHARVRARVCACPCACMRACKCACAYVSACVSAYLHVCAWHLRNVLAACNSSEGESVACHIHAYVRSCERSCMCTRVYVQPCMHTCVHERMRACVNVRACVRARACACAHVYRCYWPLQRCLARLCNTHAYIYEHVCMCARVRARGVQIPQNQPTPTDRTLSEPVRACVHACMQQVSSVRPCVGVVVRLSVRACAHVWCVHACLRPPARPPVHQSTSPPACPLSAPDHPII